MRQRALRVSFSAAREGALLYSAAMSPVRTPAAQASGAAPSETSQNAADQPEASRAAARPWMARMLDSESGDSPPDSRRAASWLALACLVAAILPIVVATIRAVAGDWLPVGDNAFFELRAADVFTEHNPLLGTWTSASLTVGVDINNPGPLLYDALAIPVKIGGDDGLAVGVALINIVSIGGIALVARRLAGPRAVVAAMAAAAGLGWAMGSELLFEPWQPHSLLFPVLCFLMMVWALACGDLAVLPWAVGVASFIVQTHIGYALLIPVLGAWGVSAAGARLWRARRGDANAWSLRRRRAWRQLVVAGLVGIACWSQSLYEQFFVDDPAGNLGKLATSLSKAGDKVGIGDAPRFVAEIAALPPWWGRPSISRAFLPGVPVPSFGASIAGLVVVAALLVGAVLVGRRLGDARGVVAAETGVVTLVVAVVAAATMPIGYLGVATHHLRWLWPVAVFITFAIVCPLVTAPGRPRAHRLSMPVLTAATVVFALLNLPAMSAQIGPSADAKAIPTTRELLPQLASLRGERGVLVDVQGQRFAEPYTAPVMVELQRLGIPWYADNAVLLRQVGSTRAHRGGASVRLFLREGDRARETPPGTRRVAFVDALTEAEADELSALKDELTPVIDDGVFTPTGPHDLSDAQLRDADYLFNSRALVGLVASDLLEVPARWSAALRRYADLQYQSDRLTVAVFAEPLERGSELDARHGAMPAGPRR
jgi:hypothetical protein